MNLTTKLLVIINLILAVFVAGVAATYYVTNENWKRRWDADTRNLSAQLLTVESEARKESFARRNAELALETTKAQIDSLAATNKTLTDDLKNKEKELANRDLRLANLNDDVQSLQDILAAKEESLGKVTARNSELNHIAQVSRGVAFSLNVKLAEIEDDLNNANVKITKSEETIATLQNEGKTMEAMLKLVEDRYPRVWTEINSDNAGYDHIVQGLVAAVRKNPQGQQDLVMLTVGADDNVQEGMEFIIYRGDQYVVKVRARKVMPDMVACWVQPETWNANGLKIEEGDVAQNRLF